ncbi:unnamed protein product [Cuscuta epithymum]|uniref:Heat shock protein 90 n=1 Tax=Cuscuta epithymum TaxID=186058 RepID=A0AAV0FTN3_9ASTE|nr:unnamed protein product [Cuscuta epithymum]CAH9138861.1 unnamed protein product [Cuscuta epithymum]
MCSCCLIKLIFVWPNCLFCAYRCYQDLDSMLCENLSDKFEHTNASMLCIDITPDKTNNSLTISDNGIGMTKAELVNMGTMARSVTKEFMEAYLAAGIIDGNMSRQSVTKEFMEAYLAAGIIDGNMSRQFGVGIYCAFLVAKKLIVRTKHKSDEQYVWESQAGDSFTLTRGSREPLATGTTITLYLKEKELEYLEERRLKDLIYKHPKFISHRIFLKYHKTFGEEHMYEMFEQQRAFWMRKPEEITEEEYAAFYKSSLTNNREEYLAVKHFGVAVEKNSGRNSGLLKFKALLFVPKRAPSDSFDAKKVNNIKLYVRRVLIMESCEELIPQYLSFVEGVVDCEDLPLNICGETLKENRIIDWMVIRKNLVNKCLELFSEIAKDKEYYTIFYEAFSKNLKLGMHEDSQNRTKLAELLRYPSTKSGDELTSLKDYVSRMEEGQHYIYYSTRDMRKKVEEDGRVKVLKQLGVEFLFMSMFDQYFVVGLLKQFEGKEFFSLDEIDEFTTGHSETVSLCFSTGVRLRTSDPPLSHRRWEPLRHWGNDDEIDECSSDDHLNEFEWKKQRKNEELKAQFENLCRVIKDFLGDEVEKVVVADRFMDSPCCLVTPEHGWSANKRMKPTMEICPEHPLVRHMCSSAKSLKDKVLTYFENCTCSCPIQGGIHSFGRMGGV